MSAAPHGHPPLRQLDRELFGPAVIGPDNDNPFQSAGTRRHRLGVRPLPVANGHAVLVVAAVVVTMIELADLDVVAVADGTRIERVRVPMGHHLHAFDHVTDAVLRRATRRPVHPQRAPATHPRRTRIQIRKVGVVIHA